MSCATKDNSLGFFEGLLTGHLLTSVEGIFLIIPRLLTISETAFASRFFKF